MFNESFAYPYASGAASTPSFISHPPHGYQRTQSFVPGTTGYAPGSGPRHVGRLREAPAFSLGASSDPGTVALSGRRRRTAEPDRHQEYPSQEWNASGWNLTEGYPREQSMWDSSRSLAGLSTEPEPRRGSGGSQSTSQRRQGNRDEFEGPHQLLEKPPNEVLVSQDRELPQLPTNLLAQEQDEILAQVNNRLSLCAYNFVARYQFPIPVEADKRRVSTPSDREWTEWVYLLKRLATKRRIPARVLYNSQIKQLVTVLENSMEMRHAAKHQSRPLKDDRNVLQLISAGIQVAKILKDADAMESLDQLYLQTEVLIHGRKMS